MDLLRAMAHSIKHRGPDGEGFFVGAGVGLAHRRLSIIDIAAGHQPMVSSDNQCAIVYNGELYNYMPLRAQLASLGHVFRTRSDTEVILQAWIRWGPECLGRFRGMFAFAIWDRSRQGMFLARDRVGIKPLYYTRLPGSGIAFASELKAVLAAPGRATERFDDVAALDYLALGYVPDPKTILSGVAKLAPGHYLWLSDECPAGQLVQYWDLPVMPAEPPANANVSAELRNRLRDAVVSHLVADVPVSTFLSGGVDSSIVTLLMARASNARVSAFSIGFDNALVDESQYAIEVARSIGVAHHVDVVDIVAQESVEVIAGCYDEPYGDSSALPTYRLCALTQQHSKVALSGDGGDEVFLGYPWYFTHRRRTMFHRWLGANLRQRIGAVARAARRRGGRAGRLPGLGFAASIAASLGDGYSQSQGFAWTEACLGPTLTNAQRHYSPSQRFDELFGRAKYLDPLRAAQYVDFKMYLPGDILTKVDRASMARSLEVRVPFLDHELVEWAWNLPAESLAPNGERKGALRQAFSTDLPNSVFRRRKQGFSIPVDLWFRKSTLIELFRSQVLRNETLLDLGWLNRANASRLLDEHVSGARDAGSTLWCLLSLGRSVARLARQL